MDREGVRDRSSEAYPGVYGSNAAGLAAIRNSPRRKNSVRVNATAVAQMIGRMIQEPATAFELVEISGLSLNTVRHYLNALRKAKAAYIYDWTECRTGVRTTKVWAVGDKPDAKKPQPKSNKEICAKYRAKMKHLKLVQQMTGQIK